MFPFFREIQYCSLPSKYDRIGASFELLIEEILADVIVILSHSIKSLSHIRMTFSLKINLQIKLKKLEYNKVRPQVRRVRIEPKNSNHKDKKTQIEVFRRRLSHLYLALGCEDPDQILLVPGLDAQCLGDHAVRPVVEVEAGQAAVLDRLVPPAVAAGVYRAVGRPGGGGGRGGGDKQYQVKLVITGVYR